MKIPCAVHHFVAHTAHGMTHLPLSSRRAGRRPV
jgi:hypothetical protein